MNNLTKILISEMMESKNKELEIRYVPYLIKTSIKPFNLNMSHYYAYYNNPEALEYVLRNGCPYLENILNKNPLDYAIERRSYESASYILSFIMNKPIFYNKVQKEKLTKLISFAPSNIKEFLDAAL